MTVDLRCRTEPRGARPRALERYIKRYYHAVGQMMYL